MSRSEENDPNEERERLDRRTLIRVAAGGVAATGLLAAVPEPSGAAPAALVPNNFRAAIHVTDENSLQYAYSALETIAEHYKKADGQLIIDGAAVKILATDDGLNNVKWAHDAGADIVAANDALAPTTLAVAASMDARAVESSVGSRRATSIDRAASAKRDLAARTSIAASPAS